MNAKAPRGSSCPQRPQDATAPHPRGRRLRSFFLIARYPSAGSPNPQRFPQKPPAARFLCVCAHYVLRGIGPALRFEYPLSPIRLIVNQWIPRTLWPI